MALARRVALTLCMCTLVLGMTLHTVAPVGSVSAVAASPGSGYSVNGFGASVALSADGTTALVGAYGKTGGNGAAYVFHHSAAGWKLQAQLVALDGAPKAWFGWAVALSADGKTALIGALGTHNQRGAAYVFTRQTGAWSELQELSADDAAKDTDFGRAVALNAAGTVALVGADAHPGGGAAYVFARGTGGWSQDQMLSARRGSDPDHFGVSVALSKDGTRALVGAQNQGDGNGAAYVFDNSAHTGWTRQGGALIGPYMGHADFGLSVALSGDGETALIGSPWTYSSSGTATLFGYDGANWTLRQVLAPADPTPGTYFGWRVALSADGKTAVIGAPWAAAATGAAYVFGRSMAGWRQEQVLSTHPGTPNQQFGMAVASSDDGKTLLIGAEGDWSTLDAAYALTRVGTALPRWAARHSLAYFHFPLINSLPAHRVYVATPTSFTTVGPMAIDNAGDLFVADEHACRLVERAPSGITLRVWGSHGTGNGQFNSGSAPCIGGIAVDRSGNVYATDRGDGRVEEFDWAGAFVRSWGRSNTSRTDLKADQFYEPGGIAVGPDGDVYVTDIGHNRIQVFTPLGGFVRSIGGAVFGLDLLAEPNSIAIDAAGRVFVSDYEQSRVQIFSRSGTFQSSFAVAGWQAGDFDAPQIAVDSRDRVLVPVPGLGLMMLYTRDGNLLYAWRVGTSATGHFSKPLYAAINAADTALVVDATGNTITSFEGL